MIRCQIIYRWTLPATLLVLSFAIPSCTQPPAESLKVGTNIWPGYETLYLASELGYISDPEIRLVEYSSASQVIRAYRNGLINAAALTLDEAMMLADEGRPIEIILVLDISSGGDVIIGHSNIRSLADLKGKRVGVENTATGAYLLTRALQLANLTTDDISVIPMEVYSHQKAFTDNEVDAIVTFEPVRSKLLAAGANLVFDSRQIPNEIIDVLGVNPEFNRKYPAVVNRLIQGWSRAAKSIQSPSESDLRFLTRRLKLPFDKINETFTLITIPSVKRNISLLSGNPPPLLLSIQTLETVMLDQHLLKNRIAKNLTINSAPLISTVANMELGEN